MIGMKKRLLNCAAVKQPVIYLVAKWIVSAINNYIVSSGIRQSLLLVGYF
jgi:hypothetical protein